MKRKQLATLESRVSAALEVAESWATIDGDHHKQWVIDQMIRALLGDEYDAWVSQYNGNEEATDEWNVGIAP